MQMGTELDRIGNALQRPGGMADTLPADPPFAFRHSYTEISLQGGAARVWRSETRFQEGRLVTEESEGMLDSRAYQRMVEQSQQVFLEQMKQAVRLFFLPFSSSDQNER
jgi:hypothetical protein